MDEQPWRRPNRDERDEPRYPDDRYHRGDYDDRPYYRERSHYEEPHRGVVILVLGILSLVGGVICGLLMVAGPFAWIMGMSDLRKMNRGIMDPEGRGLTQAGMITGIIGTVFLVLFAVFLIVYVVIIVLAVGLK